MSEDDDSVSLELAREKLELERYKALLNYKKFIFGSVFAAITIAAIPPLFQLATAALEYVKSNADRQARQQTFRDDYIKQFVSNALNQDIELRIRFAQYFSRVSTEPYREDWVEYLSDLRASRDDIRFQIDKLEGELLEEYYSTERNQEEILRLERNLAWAYQEVGYVERDRSSIVNTRSKSQPVASSSPRELDSKVTYSIPSKLLAGNVFVLGRFTDAVYWVRKDFMLDSAGRPPRRLVTVPAGFVVTFDSIPRELWDSPYAYENFGEAEILHDFLYWEQDVTREEADLIFKDAMQLSWYDEEKVEKVYQGVRSSGQAVWDRYAKSKAAGENRYIVKFPKDLTVKWADWKRRRDIYK